MTQKIYEEKPYMQKAAVEVVTTGKDGQGEYLVLDGTIFYPEGGGQPADHGFIGPARIVDVQKVDEEIRHYTDQPLPKAVYEARLDWDRRWDHMQQHAGQHVLSAVFDDNHQMKTTSFHLGKERVSIDLDAGSVTEKQLLEVEKQANAVISQHLPISVEWVTQQQAANKKLRKPPAVDGAIRLVTIDGIDINACGGTHPQNTSDINLIKLIGTEKAKGGTRVYFVCGNRALLYFQKLIEITDQLVKQLNSPLEELVAAASALSSDKAEKDKTIKELQSMLLKTEAENFQPEQEGGLLVRSFQGRPVKEIQQLARWTAAAHPAAVILFVLNAGQEKRFVCAKGEQAPGDMRKVLQELLVLIDGKGGGNIHFAQGGGKTDQPDADFFHLFRRLAKDFQESV
ncbi:alanyl-tRNA editing protein [Planococcus salinus]|uniref:Alanyl-tRNA editing protein n=1 Tax=Planococcus salinus TaxID=1848460 RepID=A0A3M8P9K6_9BACL|nr:DHHA1 domain-containing protein [Planococcus salinus]RNF40111.1 alanyl-tRNA editing protein [Planococcus salinus]